jgi:hypothetical protein
VTHEHDGDACFGRELCERLQRNSNINVGVGIDASVQVSGNRVDDDELDLVFGRKRPDALHAARQPQRNVPHDVNACDVAANCLEARPERIGGVILGGDEQNV